MPSGSYKQVLVKCPYYVFDNGKTVLKCEGLPRGTTSLSHTFRHNSDMIRHMDRFCCNAYWDCLVCEALDEKHRED